MNWSVDSRLAVIESNLVHNQDCNFLVSSGLVMEKLDKITLQNIAEERVDIISEEMQLLSDEYIEELKNSLRVIINGNDDSQEKKEFMALQKLVHARSDFTVESLLQAHRAQLEILAAMKMGTQTLLDPMVSRSSLVEIFAYKRRNIIADDCMCVICNKFDNEVDFRWLGCHTCSHLIHTECAIRDGLISMSSCPKRFRPDQTGEAELVFRCRVCSSTCKLLGWVKSVFQQRAFSWNQEELMTQLDILSRIFRGSEDVKGRKLFWKCEELAKKLKGGLSESTACRELLMFFREDSEELLASKKEGLGEEVPIVLHELEEAARLLEAKQDKSKKRSQETTASAQTETDPILEWKEVDEDDASNRGKRPNTSSKNPIASISKEHTPQEVSTSFPNRESGDRALMLRTILNQAIPHLDRERMKAAESFEDKMDNATFILVEGCLRTLDALAFTAQARATLESKIKELQKQFEEERTQRKKLEDELRKKKREVSHMKQELIESWESFARFSKEEEHYRVARVRDLEAMKTTLGSYIERELSYFGSRSQVESGDTMVNQEDEGTRTKRRREQGEGSP